MPRTYQGAFQFDPWSELWQARQGNGYMAENDLVGAGVNPNCVVFFNPAGSGAWAYVDYILVAASAAVVPSLYFLGVDPALTAGAVPQNRYNAGGGTVTKTEAAQAALPANQGIIIGAELSAGGNLELLQRRMLICPAGSGLMVATPAVIATLRVTMMWYELYT